jgi:orotate phosphoribosyltransferase-like protein
MERQYRQHHTQHGIRHQAIKYCRKYLKTVILFSRAAVFHCCRHQKRPMLAYNSGFDFTIEDQNIMEAERINAISALLSDLTVREAELRRYL